MNETIEKVLAHKGDIVEAVAPDTSVLRAVERMNECHIGSLVVCDGERPIGIFTERDVLVRVVARGLDPKRTPVGEVMTRDLIAMQHFIDHIYHPGAVLNFLAGTIERASF